jgi:hypothetical protein
VTARPFALAALLTALAPAGPAFALSPLVVDDADTVERGRVQVNAGWQLVRRAPEDLHTASANAVLGLSASAEVGTTFGYQWRNGSGEDAHGITDLAFASKFRLWRSANDALKATARLDLKLPTASTARGLGTGDADFGVTLIATRCWGGHTCLDANGGYTAVDGSRVVFGDDRYLLGLAARHQRTTRWVIIGEGYALIPHGSGGNPASVHFDVGAQFVAGRESLLSMLIGSAAGRDAPDVSGYLGFTRVF